MAHSKKRLGEQDLYFFNEGTHCRIFQHLGAHQERPGQPGCDFAVWAPNARAVSVIGDFNDWDESRHPLQPTGSSGIWRGRVADANVGHCYKYFITSNHDGYQVRKADPVGFQHEVPPRTASVVADLRHDWHDADWMARRGQRIAHDAPVSIYEVHLGSWMRSHGQRGQALGYRELGERLVEHVRTLGFTHVQLMPIMEHPFYGSWGYQTTGYFAPTSRYGTPQDMKYLVDLLHQNEIGVILDWVPSHFPNDQHGLDYFDGTHLYEHADPRKGFHPDWTSNIYNYGRHEVVSFLISSAIFWLDEYHVDGLRVDAVASMLYLDYSRKEGEWIPNEDGSNENREAIAFLRRFNETVYREYPDVHTVAEESTAWANVSRPTSMGGLGFGYKWDMGWMHDTLEYMERDPVHRTHHHDEITFRAVYTYTENYVLPLSHDEVVHGKQSLLQKMPGDEWQRFANLRTLYGYMFAQPGKKLLFMGGEFGVTREWNHDEVLQWQLADRPFHAGLLRWVHDVNHLYMSEPPLHQRDVIPGGFEWLDWEDRSQSILAFLRIGHDDDHLFAIICNFTPVPRPFYRIGVPRGGTWREVLNSDATYYDGSGQGNLGALQASDIPSHGRPHSLELNVPPLSCLFLKSEAPPE